MHEPTRDSDTAVRSMQIIAGALIAGVLVFAGIAVLAAGPPVAAGNRAPVVAIVLAAFAVLQLPMLVVLPQIMVRQADQSNATPQVRYQALMVLRMALCEGAGFANVIGYIVDKQWWSLGIVGGLVVVMLTLFPTRTRLEHWLETQQFESQQGR